MADVFLVYAQKTRDLAMQVAEALQASRFSVYTAESLPGGNPISQQLKEAESAKCVVTLWSESAIKSTWIIFDEVRVGLRRGVLVQATLDGTLPPSEFRDQLCVDLSGWNGQTWDTPFIELTRQIHSVTGMGAMNRIKRERMVDLSRPTRQDVPPAPQETQIVIDSSAGKRVFLCYRRQDTQGHTGRLRDRLVTAHGRDAVFMDVDDVPYGVDFVDHIEEVLKGCAVMMVMIGSSWATLADKKGRRKLDSPDDLVRGEIAAALKRKIPVIPVLVEDASMPDAEDVPDEIRGLTRRNAIELTHRRWEDDVQRVLKVVEKFMGAAKGPTS